MYQLTSENWVRKYPDIRIPLSDDVGVSHPDTLEYLDWLAAGNTPDPPSAKDLEIIRERLQSKRSALRVQHQTGGFMFEGHRYASDRDESIPLLLNCALSAQMVLATGPDAVASFEAALGGGWRSTDGVGRITTATGILALHTAFVAHGAACDHHSQQLKALIAAPDADLDALEAEVETGWPE
jgi:hypothetical protein